MRRQEKKIRVLGHSRFFWRLWKNFTSVKNLRVSQYIFGWIIYDTAQCLQNVYKIVLKSNSCNQQQEREFQRDNESFLPGLLPLA